MSQKQKVGAVFETIDDSQLWNSLAKCTWMKTNQVFTNLNSFVLKFKLKFKLICFALAKKFEVNTSAALGKGKFRFVPVSTGFRMDRNFICKKKADSFPFQGGPFKILKQKFSLAVWVFKIKKPLVSFF